MRSRQYLLLLTAGLFASILHLIDANALKYKRYSEHTRSRQRRGDVIEAGGEGLLVEPRLEFQSVVPPNEVDVNTYESISLECHAGGSPPAKIHWLKDGERIIQGPSSDDAHVESYAQPQLGLATTNSRLVLDCVTSRDAGMYSCVAETAFGRIRTDSLVQITDSNKVISSGCPAQKRKYGMPAKIYMWTGNRLEVEGNTVRLFCRTSGYPAPMVIWIGPSDQILDNNDKYQTLENGDLRVSGITWEEDMGEYKCVAENEFGADMVDTFLYPTLGL